MPPTWRIRTILSTRISPGTLRRTAYARSDTAKSWSARTSPTARRPWRKSYRVGWTARATAKTSWIRASSRWALPMRRVAPRGTACTGCKCWRRRGPRAADRGAAPHVLRLQRRHSCLAGDLVLRAGRAGTSDRADQPSALDERNAATRADDPVEGHHVVGAIDLDGILERLGFATEGGRGTCLVLGDRDGAA